MGSLKNYGRVLNTCLLLIFILSGCRSISSPRERMGVPEGMVVFTFDDGPNNHEDTTERLLDVLKKYNITAMFALLGENARQYPELTRRIYSEGHYIINHGRSARFSFRLKDDEFCKNLLEGEEDIRSALGDDIVLSPLLYRPQGGFYYKRQYALWNEQGYTLVPANVRVYDAVKGKDAKDETVRNVVRKVERRKGGIILLHDARETYSRMERALERNRDGAFNRSWIPDAVEEIILILSSKGYRLSNIDLSFMWNNTVMDHYDDS